MHYFETLEQSLEHLADFRYDFFRGDMDQYKGKVLKLSNIKANLQDSDCLLFAPMGSRWAIQLGANSYFGMPCYLQGTYWLGIGKTKIVRHQTRNAFPISKVYIFNFKKHQRNEQIVRGLQNLIVLKEKSLSNGHLAKRRIKTGINHIHLESRQMLQKIEIDVLQKAMQYYKKGKLLYFSTYLLSEDMHPKKMLQAFDYLEGINEEIEQVLRSTSTHIVIKNTNSSFFNKTNDVKTTMRAKSVDEHPTKLNQFWVWFTDYIKRLLD